MPIKITSIEITNSGVNILGDEVEILELADGTTRELKVRGYAAPCGINDGKDIGAHMTKILGEAVALPIAERAVLQAERNQERAAKQALETELQTERAARQLAEAQKEVALAEVERVRNEKPISIRDPDSNIPVGR